MERKLIKAFVYGTFNEKVGPVAIAWLPEDLSPKKMESICFTTMSISYNMKEMSKSIASVPLPQLDMKALARYIEFKDETLRGGTGFSALMLILDDANDVIIYKYFPQIKELMEKYSEKALQIEEDRELKDLSVNKAVFRKEVQDLLGDLQKEFDDLLDFLEQEELKLQSTEAFPEDNSIGKEKPKLRFKIVVCGDPEVGKTSLILQFTDKAFRTTYIPTIGVNISEKLIAHDGKQIEFVIWDLAGQTKFFKMRKHFYEGSSAVIVVFDLTRKETFANVKQWYDDTERYFQSRVFTILLGNKNDLDEQRAIAQGDASDLANSLNIQYFETSARTGSNVDDVFHEIAQYLTTKHDNA